MALRDLLTFNIATAGIRDSVQRIGSIRRARQELERKREIDDLTIQEKKLNLQRQAMQNNMTGMEQRFFESQLAEIEKTKRAEQTATSGKIDIAEITEKNRMGMFTNAAKQAAQSPDVMASLMGVQPEREVQEPEPSTVARNLNPNLPRVSYRKKVGNFQISTGGRKQEIDKTEEINKAMGAVDAGGHISGGGSFKKFADRKEAENYLSTKLGYGWKDKHPEAVQLLNRKFVELPGTVKKTSEALDYLTNETGMSREEAVQWLRQNNSRTIKVK